MSATELIPAPLSPRFVAAVYVSGALAGLGAGLALLGQLSLQSPLLGGYGHFSIAVFTQGFAAFTLLTLPSQVNNRRRELLARREAGDASVTFVEMAPRSESVWLGVLFGMLGVVSFTVLFAPAAIVAGVVALANRHLGGLIGLGLGVGGVSLWLWLVGAA
jgi:hypothetical protein